MRFTINIIETKPAIYLLLEKIFLTAGNRQANADYAGLRENQDELFMVKETHFEWSEFLSRTLSITKRCQPKNSKNANLRKNLEVKRYKS